MKRTDEDSPERLAFPWRWAIAETVYWAFWGAGVLVAMTVATYIFNRDMAHYAYTMLNHWLGSDYSVEHGLIWITWPARAGGFFLALMVLYGSWLRFKRWGQRLQSWILGRKLPIDDADTIV